MYWCASCEYKSNRRFNMQIHIRNKHKREPFDKELSNKKYKDQITSSTEQPTAVDLQITANDQKSIIENQLITANNEQITAAKDDKKICPKCSKNFKSLSGFKKHQKTCKGVSNILECHFCHLVLGTQQAKSKHIKRCKVRKAQELLNENKMVINNQINNHVQNFQNNSQLIIQIADFQSNRKKHYDTDSDDDYDIENINDFGNENTSYISDEFMIQLVKDRDLKTLIYEKHFNPEHPENHNIRKNCRKSYKILKNKKWVIDTKDGIHAKIYSNIRTPLFDLAQSLKSVYDPKQFDEYMAEWSIYDKVSKKRLITYIDVHVEALIKNKKRKQIEKKKQEMLQNTPVKTICN